MLFQLTLGICLSCRFHLFPLRLPLGRPFSNPAWPAVCTGFEIQIDNSGAGQEWRFNGTGAVYPVSYPGNPSEIAGFAPGTAWDFVNSQAATVLGWNQYRIEVSNNIIKVALNGVDTWQHTILNPTAVHFPPPYDQSCGRFPVSVCRIAFTAIRRFLRYPRI